MQHKAKDLLAAEIAKLTRWQVALADKTGVIVKKMEVFGKDSQKTGEVFGHLLASGKAMFEIWERINAAMADGGIPEEEDLKTLQRGILSMGGSTSERWHGKQPGDGGFYAKSVTGRRLTDELHDWTYFKANVNDPGHNAAYIKQLDVHQLPHWMDGLYELVIDGGFDEIIESVQKDMSQLEGIMTEFKKEADAFFKSVPEGTERFYDPKDPANKANLTRRLLGISAPGGGDNGAGALTMSNLQTDSRKAIKNVIEFWQYFLKATQAMISGINDTVELSNHFVGILHKVSVEAIAELKADGKEIPADLQEAHDALSPKALKAASK